MIYWLLEKFLILNIIPKALADGESTTPSSGISIQNPLESDTIEGLIVNIIDFVVMISIPILTLVILYAAFLMFTAGGKEEQFKQGRTALLYAAIGFAILLASEGIGRLIEAVVVGTDISV